MASGPVEILTVVFPGSNFSGLIVPELQKLVESETITIIDGLIVHIDEDGTESFAEFDEISADSDESTLSGLLERVDGLISDDDVHELLTGLEPNTTAAVLVFEHTWAKGLRDAVVGSGGILLDSTRVPGPVVDEVLSALAELEELEVEGE